MESDGCTVIASNGVTHADDRTCERDFRCSHDQGWEVASLIEKESYAWDRG